MTIPKLLFYFPEYQVIFFNNFYNKAVKTQFALKGHIKLFSFKYLITKTLSKDKLDELSKRIIYIKPLINVFRIYEKRIKLIYKKYKELGNKLNISEFVYSKDCSLDKSSKINNISKIK